MNLSSTRHLGGTITAGSITSGSRYASHTTRAPHTYCWMELAVFPSFPDVPSLAGTQVQGRLDLLASTKGAGAPQETNLTLEVELFDDECPQLCANFRRLCNGESSTRQGTVYCHQGLTPSYRGTYFHKIIPGYCAQGGDITMRVVPGGSNSYSSAGRGWLNDESKKRRHNEVGLVSMANNGPNSNGSQFFITTSAANERSFNGRHCCVGRVVRGLEQFMRLVAPCGDKDGRPSRYVVVVDCGEGTAPPPPLSPLTSFDQTGVTAAQEPQRQEEKDEIVDEAPLTESTAALGAEDGAAANDIPEADATEAKAVAAARHSTEAVPAATSSAPWPASAGSASEPAAAATATTAAAAMKAPTSSLLPLKSSMKKGTAASNKHVTYKE